MEKLSYDEDTKYLKECLPILKHMKAAIAPQIIADETLLDHFSEADMTVKVLADASEIDGLYYCGFLTENEYALCSKAADKIKQNKLTAFKKRNGGRDVEIVTEPPSNMVCDYLKRKGIAVPFSDDNADVALMVQGAAQLYEMLRYNRSGFETNLSDPLSAGKWFVQDDPGQTAYQILFNLNLLHKSVQSHVPPKDKNKKSEILLETLIRDFYQRICETSYAMAEEDPSKKPTRMMGMGYMLSQRVGPDISLTDNRRKMLMTGLIQSVRDDIQKMGIDQAWKKGILNWYDGCTAPYLKTVRTYVQKGVDKALKNIGNQPKTKA